MTAIAQIVARQILDSRGRPTVEVDVTLKNGSFGRASVPAGASRGSAEAFELRDMDPTRWNGRSVDKAIAIIHGEIQSALRGMDSHEQRAIDDRLRTLDGTPNFSCIGGNSALGVSLAVARATAASDSKPLHARIAEISGTQRQSMPLPMVNILSGGLHAGRGMDIQDFLAVPLGARSYSESLDWACRVRDAASQLVAAQGLPTLLADEGGLSPGFSDTREALDLMVRAIETAGLQPARDVAIALDIASSSLLDDHDRYHFARAARDFSSDEFTALLESWVRDYPIVSIEDGLAEDDWSAWPNLTRRLAHIQIIGDDLFATNSERIARGIKAGAANSVLIKVNQNGTLTGTLDAMALARSAGYSTVVSARSGETEDSFIADLAVGTGAGQIKIGSVRNSERLAKYNQLLRIEASAKLEFAGRAALAGTKRSNGR